MSNTVKCKKCDGRGEHRHGQKCGTCKGSGRVTIIVDKDGRTVVAPAVRS